MAYSILAFVLLQAIVFQSVLSDIGYAMVRGHGLGKTSTMTIDYEADPVIKNIETIPTSIEDILGPVAWSPDNRFIAVLSSKTIDQIVVLIIDSEHKSVIKELPIPIPMYVPTQTLAFSPDGSYLAVPLREKVRLWETKNWTEVRDLSFSTDTDPFVASGMDAIAFSHNGKVLTAKSDSFWWPNGEKRRGFDVLRELSEKEEEAKRSHKFTYSELRERFGKHIPSIISVSVDKGNRLGYKGLFSPESQVSASDFELIDGNLSYSSDDKFVINGISHIHNGNPGSDKPVISSYIQLRDSSNLEVSQRLDIASPDNKITTLKPLSENRVVVGFSENQTRNPGVFNYDSILMYDIAKKSVLRKYQDHFTKKIRGFSVDKNERLLVAFYGFDIEIWDLKKEKLLKYLRLNKNGISDCLLSPDGKTIAVTFFDNYQIHLIDIK